MRIRDGPGLTSARQNRRGVPVLRAHRAGCGTPGLFSEEYDIRQRQLRGNLPQAFVHALLFEASSTLARHTEADMTTTERQQETLQERKL